MRESSKKWLDTEREDVCRRYLAGDTAAAIGRDFGVGRSSILGIVHRAGVKRVAASSPVAKTVSKRRAVKVKPPVPETVSAEAVAEVITAVAQALRMPEAVVSESVVSEALVPDAFVSAPVGIMDLGSGQCRAPAGVDVNGDGLFCARPVRGFRQSYCQACHVRLHAPRAQKVKRLTEKPERRQAVYHGW